MQWVWTCLQNTNQLWSSRFFLKFLGGAEPEEIRDYLGSLSKQSEDISKSVSDFVIYSEGAVDWTTAWSIGLPDQSLLLESFTNYLNAKSGNKDNEMVQEQIVDNAPPVSDE